MKKRILMSVAITATAFFFASCSFPWQAGAKNAEFVSVIESGLLSSEEFDEIRQMEEEEKRLAEAEAKAKAEAEEARKLEEEKKKKAEEEASEKAEEEKRLKEEQEAKAKAEEEKKRKISLEEEEKKQAEAKAAAEAEAKAKAEAEEAARQEELNKARANAMALPPSTAIDIANNARAEAGLTGLTLDATLNSLATQRAQEAAQVFSHTRPDNRSCFSILDDNAIAYMTCGENLAAGQQTEEEVMNAWLNSPGHRANILNGAFHKIGLGYFDAGDAYGRYWVTIFTD